MIEIKNKTGANIYWILKEGNDILKHGTLSADLNLAYKLGLILEQYDNKSNWETELKNNGITLEEE